MELLEQDKKDAPAKRGRGRPRCLENDAPTLRLLSACGRIQCTTKETSAFFGVAEQTLLSFLSQFPEARAAFDEAKEFGKLSLRRAQLRTALAGNPTMQIWLGKQLLGQVDKSEVEHSGGLDVSYTQQRVRDKASAVVGASEAAGSPEVPRLTH